MSTSVNLSTVRAATEIAGEDEEERELLRDALIEAREYLRTFKWCQGIKEEFFGLGVGGVVAVFLFHINPLGDADEWLWVVSGDVPSAYFVTDRASTPNEALGVYCDIMEEWIRAVRTGSGLDEVFPVATEATEESANALERRVAFLRDDVIPVFQ